MSVRQHIPPALQPMVQSAALTVGTATRRWRTDPSFLVIGGQRCGTTTIFKSLSEHPQLLRPPVGKGTDYYTLNYHRGMEWYRSRMPLARAHVFRRTHAPLQAFEACTYYMFHPFAIERIARDFPDIRLVAMLRNPIDRAYSAYKHEVARGFETETNFLRALQVEDARLAGETERMRRDVTYESIAHRHHAYRHRGQFVDQLRQVYSMFPRDRVHVMDSESFFADPMDEYRQLVDFLGLTRWEPASIGQHNARPSSAMPEDASLFLAEHYAPYNAELADLLGRPLSWSSQ